MSTIDEQLAALRADIDAARKRIVLRMAAEVVDHAKRMRPVDTRQRSWDRSIIDLPPSACREEPGR